MTNHRNLGHSGLMVSPLCLGTMNFGNKDFGCDEAASLEMTQAYLDAGFNFIDTANRYSDTLSETILGKALKGHRHEVVLATKAGNPVGPGTFDVGTSRKALMKAVDDSLRRLDTDYIDLYQMHRFDATTPLEETLSTLNDLVRSGKVRHVGVSNWGGSQITDAVRLCQQNNWESLISLQPQYNIISREIEIEVVPACLKFGLGIIPYSPLGFGMLTGKYRRDEAPAAGTRLSTLDLFKRNLKERNFDIVDVVVEEAQKIGVAPAALSIAWTLRMPGIVSPIIGPKNMQQLTENMKAVDVNIPDETLARINEASEPEVLYPHNFLRLSPTR